MPNVRNTPHWKPVFGLLNGGLDMAVNAFYGAETVWHVEFDAAPSKILAHHWPHVPNYGDVTRIDWQAVEPVDILTGGFPCQDVSAAGRRAGLAEGTRSGLWSHMATAIDQLRPRYVVIENVKGLLSAEAHRNVEPEPDAVGDGRRRPVLRALGAVLGDLSDLGYDAQWITVSAASVGACHRRERVFILAIPADATNDRQHELDDRSVGAEARRRRVRVTPGGDRGQAAADTAGVGRVAGPLLPTPSANDGNGGRQRSSDALARGDHQANLTDLPRLLPTPMARDHKGTSFDPADTTRLPNAVNLLPTPRSRDHHSAQSRLTRGSGPDLPSVVEVGALLPTPSAAECTGGGQHPDRRVGHSRQLIDYALAIEPDWGKYEAAIRRAEQATGRPAPAPTEPNRNGKPRLNAAFAEWMMMLPDGWVTDPAIGLSRAQQLKAIGNGVCPPQAHRALQILHNINLEEVAS